MHRRTGFVLASLLVAVSLAFGLGNRPAPAQAAAATRTIHDPVAFDICVEFCTTTVAAFLAGQGIQLNQVLAVEIVGPPIRNFGGLISAINHTSDTLALLPASLSLVDISVVDVSPFLVAGPPIHPALANALERNSAALSLLRSRLGATPISAVGPPIRTFTIYFQVGPPI